MEELPVYTLRYYSSYFRRVLSGDSLTRDTALRIYEDENLWPHFVYWLSFHHFPGGADEYPDDVPSDYNPENRVVWLVHMYMFGVDLENPQLIREAMEKRSSST